MCAWARASTTLLHSLERVRLTFPLYTGAFLGPFGGAMLIALIPNVAEGLDTSLALVAGAITAYMVPFAALQLVSGTLASRLGPRRIVRAGYLVYGGAALVCAFSRRSGCSSQAVPSWERPTRSSPPSFWRLSRRS
jgi:MFS family permease